MRSNFKSRKSVFFIVVPALLIVASALFFVACQKSSNTLSNADDNGGYASDASRIEWATDDAISIADAAGQVYNGAYMGPCCTVGVDTMATPHTLVIRFGDKDCLCADNRYRSGSIIVTYNGEYTDTAQMHTITFNNYYINDNLMTGSITTNRVDTTIVGNWYYKVGVNNSLTVSPTLNAQFTTWQGNLVRKWAQGYETSDRNQEVFSVSGSATLTRQNTHAFNFNIATPLQLAINCNYVESGVVNVVSTLGSRVLNYGSGSCDPYAQLNIGIHVYQLILTP